MCLVAIHRLRTRGSSYASVDLQSAASCCDTLFLTIACQLVAQRLLLGALLDRLTAATTDTGCNTLYCHQHHSLTYVHMLCVSYLHVCTLTTVG
jgi:hypothetical protein